MLLYLCHVNCPLNTLTLLNIHAKYKSLQDLCLLHTNSLGYTVQCSILIDYNNLRISTKNARYKC